MRTRSGWLVLSALVGAFGIVACSDDESGVAGAGGTGGSGASSAGGSGGVGIDSGLGGGSSGTGGSAAGAGCDPPDMLIVLDRTMSMHRRPDGSVPPDTTQGHAESKWSLAVTAIEALTGKLDTTLRFGLELFPREEFDAQNTSLCVTISERINGVTATNVACQAGEVLVSPALSTASAIAAQIDPEATRLCTSTPIGAAFQTATQELATVKVAGRDQYALFIGDGQDTCDDALVISAAHQLAQAGVRTFVIGFDSTAGTGVSKSTLNHIACAGKTAKGFPAPCTDDGSGNYTATNPDGEVLYLFAQSGAELTQALSSIAGSVCCNCVP